MIKGHEEVKERPPYKQKVQDSSGYTPDTQELLREAAGKEFFTQYCNVVNTERQEIRQTLLIIVWPHGAEYYAID